MIDLREIVPHSALTMFYYILYGTRGRLRFRDAQYMAPLPILKDTHLTQIKKSDTVFILGSGSTINSIAPARWKAISMYDSIGFNFWLAHEHVPDIYAFEVMNGRILEKISVLSSKRADDYSDSLKIMTDLFVPSPQGRKRTLEALAPAFKRNLFTAPTVSAISRNCQELNRCLGFLDRYNMVGIRPDKTRLFKYRGTLSMLIMMSIWMGYKNIVLCGVDLNNSEYFYEDDELYPDMAGFRSSGSGEKHATDVSTNMTMGMSGIVTCIARLYHSSEVNFYVENEASALYPSLPVAPDYLFEVGRE